MEDIKEIKAIELTSDISSKIIAILPKMYKTFWDDASKMREQHEILKFHIFLEVCEQQIENAPILPGIYKRFLTYKAFLKSSLCPSYDAAFDVAPEDSMSYVNADKQKAMIIKELNNMDYYEILDKYIIDRALKGESYRFIRWKKYYKNKRRPVSILAKTIFDIKNMLGMEVDDDTDTFKMVKVLDYEGCEIENIDPFSIVFDKSNPDWAKRAKIFRFEKTYEQIEQDGNYSNYKSLKHSGVDSSTEQQKKSVTNTVDGESPSPKIELLEMWGDLLLDDGTLLEDYVIVVADKKKVIRFEPNPLPLCPIIRSSFLDNPETGRGISPFIAAIPLNQKLSDLYFQVGKAVELIINRPGVGPKDLFEKKVFEWLPGKFIGLEVDEISGRIPKIDFLDFSPALQAMSLFPMINEEIQSATGIYDNMAGMQAEGNPTATEISATVTGQQKRIDDEAKDISRELIIKDIKDIAELNASFRIHPMDVKVASNGGMPNFEQANADVWNGNYTYTYGDSTSKNTRLANLQKNLSIIEQFAKLPMMVQVINWLELFKWTMQQFGMDNVDKFINEGLENGQVPMPGVMGQPPIPNPNEGMPEAPTQ